MIKPIIIFLHFSKSTITIKKEKQRKNSLLFFLCLSCKLLFELALVAACRIRPLPQVRDFSVFTPGNNRIITLQFINSITIINDMRFAIKRFSAVVLRNQFIKFNHYQALQKIIIIFLFLATLYHIFIFLSRNILILFSFFNLMFLVAVDPSFSKINVSIFIIFIFQND